MYLQLEKMRFGDELLYEIQVADNLVPEYVKIPSISKYKKNGEADGIIVILLFLDIDMPNYSGLEIMDFMSAEEETFEIVFVTAYSEYAIHAFRLYRAENFDCKRKAIRSGENDAYLNAGI